MKKYFLQFTKHMRCNPLSCKTKSLPGFFCLVGLFGVFFLVVVHSLIKEEIILPRRLMNSHV